MGQLVLKWSSSQATFASCAVDRLRWFSSAHRFLSKTSLVDYRVAFRPNVRRIQPRVDRSSAGGQEQKVAHLIEFPRTGRIQVARVLWGGRRRTLGGTSETDHSNI